MQKWETRDKKTNFMKYHYHKLKMKNVLKI